MQYNHCNSCESCDASFSYNPQPTTVIHMTDASFSYLALYTCLQWINGQGFLETLNAVVICLSSQMPEPKWPLCSRATKARELPRLLVIVSLLRSRHIPEKAKVYSPPLGNFSPHPLASYLGQVSHQAQEWWSGFSVQLLLNQLFSLCHPPHGLVAISKFLPHF